jgi:hypothetical protein
MQPYEIRQFRDGSIDYNNYYARPISLMPAVRRLCRWAAAGPSWEMAIRFAARLIRRWQRMPTGGSA